jgi:3'-phosphoadenosine 5'-phosphosulfate sulfotransferase (PAPS reductase)/FAD synthetase
VKASYNCEDDNCNTYNQEELVSRLYKELLQINKKKKNPIEKWTKDKIRQFIDEEP